MATLSISVIVCTYNPRSEYLCRLLEALDRQTLSKDRWELLLVDNASKDRLELSWNLSWHRQARHVRAEDIGLTQARLRGISESRGALLIFFDDDNVPQPNFLEQALLVQADHPFLGVFGDRKSVV